MSKADAEMLIQHLVAREPSLSDIVYDMRRRGVSAQQIAQLIRAARRAS